MALTTRKMREEFERKLSVMQDGKRPEHNTVLPIEKYQETIQMLKDIQHKHKKGPLEYRLTKRFEIHVVEGEEKLILPRIYPSDHVRFYVPFEEMFHILHDCHISIGHGGRNRMVKELNTKYCNVTKDIIMAYLGMCQPCQVKNSALRRGLMTGRPAPIAEFTDSHGLFCLIDMHLQPCGQYCYILLYTDGISKFVIMKPLSSDRPDEIVPHLLEIFSTIGAPVVLKYDLENELPESSLRELRNVWKDMTIVQMGRNNAKRPPFVQDNSDLLKTEVEVALISWMNSNNTSDWVTGLRFVQMTCNTKQRSDTQRTPYEALFGHKITSDFESNPASLSTQGLVHHDAFGATLEEHIAGSSLVPIAEKTETGLMRCLEVVAEFETITDTMKYQKDEMTSGDEVSSNNVLVGDQLTGSCDDVSIPVSPQQYLTEDSDNSPADGSNASQRPESYKLRHNNHLSLVLESLAGDESFMDVTLTAQGKSIKAHKSVLSAVSPYFRGVLKENPCQHPIIIMPRDIKFEELHNIISYVYKGEMTVAADDLASLLKTAEILQVTGLTPSEAMTGIPGQIHNLAKTLSQASSPSNPSVPTQPTTSRKRPAEKRASNKAKAMREGPSEDILEARIDPADFLSADMTLIKEEIDSDVELNHEPPPILKEDKPEVGSADQPDPLRPPDGTGEKDVLSQDPLQDPLQLEKELSSDTSLKDSSHTHPFNCPHCSETHRPLDVLISHLRLKHPTKPSHHCKCARVFVKMSAFTEHQKKCPNS